MSEQPVTDQDRQEPVTEQAEVEQAADDQPDDQPDEHPNREAAKWRRQLRDAEAERDELAERVAALQRQAVDQLTEQAGIRPAAFWAGTELADLIGSDGSVDVDRVEQAIRTIRDEFGLPGPLSVPSEGRTSQHRPEPSMASAIMGR